jgi:hypothetical protein
VGFKIVAAVIVKSSVFWDISACSPFKINLRFRGMCRLRNVGWLSTGYTALYHRRYHSNNISNFNLLTGLRNVPFLSYGTCQIGGPKHKNRFRQTLIIFWSINSLCSKSVSGNTSHKHRDVQLELLGYISIFVWFYSAVFRRGTGNLSSTHNF